MLASRSIPAVAGPALLSACLLLAWGPASAQQIRCDTMYTIQPGDSLGKIAVRVGIAPVDRMVDWIRRANEETIASADLIFVGDILYIPCGDLSFIPKDAMRSPEALALEAAPAAMPALPMPVAAAPVAAAPVADGRASRIFSGPGQFPPRSFGAYAIIAFKSEPPAMDRQEFARYRDICDAYVRSIPPASEDRDRRQSELVTVWPMKTDDSALDAMQAPRDEQCDVAARQYGLRMALDAIRHAKKASGDLADDFAERDGPFLLAWNPASMKGEPDALILRMDLSWVRTAGQARQAFEFWVQRIETNTDLWLDDWETRPIDQIVANTADNWGQAIIDSIAFLVGRDG